MTTDTAVRVTRIVVQDKGKASSWISIAFPPRPGVNGTTHLSPPAVALDRVPYDDFPELKFNDKESTEMPFRYVKGNDGKPIMPEVSQPPVSALLSPVRPDSAIGDARPHPEGRRQGHR